MQSTGNVIEVNAYYPYGKIIQGLSTSSTYGKNNYKYNGKELQTELELNWLDYGARMLDRPRWFVPDPLAEKYYSYSPYVYCANNPIMFIDPDGEDWTDINGNILDEEALKQVKVYIFHDNDFSKQAQVQYNDAVKKYGKGAVALSNTGSTDGFLQIGEICRVILVM